MDTLDEMENAKDVVERASVRIDNLESALAAAEQRAEEAEEAERERERDKFREAGDCIMSGSLANARRYKQAESRLARAQEALREWGPILEVVKQQDIKWKKPMPEIDFGDEGIYVWALKAQEEMGELSAALLGGLIGKEGRGDVLEECYQLIAVLLRIARAALPKEEGRLGD